MRLQRIDLLLTDTLEPTKPRRVRHVRAIGQEGADVPEYTDRHGDQLIDTDYQTREAFNKALAKRFLPRYKASLLTRTHPIDRVISLSPKMLHLNHTDVLLSSTAGAAAGLPSTLEVKERIYSGVLDLMSKAVVDTRARSTAGTGAGGRQRG